MREWSAGADEETPFSVGELVGFVGETLRGAFPAVLVVGEIAAWSEAGSGHCYFTISDDESSIDCVMWRAQASRLAFRPAVGDEVLCRGGVALYERQGRLQLYVSAMKPVGAGAAARSLEQLKRRLAAEGLFDPQRKRPLPFLPSRIGIVTSTTGAALQDILRTISLRFNAVEIVVAGAVVQGSQAPDSICSALALIRDHGNADVVIVGRGGGASEDLAAFNDERVVRAIATMPVAVVSAVGHEIDTTLCDLVADHRAATPTAAAQAVVPQLSEIAANIDALDHRVSSAALRRVKSARLHLDTLARVLPNPGQMLAQARQKLDDTGDALSRGLIARYDRAAADLSAGRERLLSVARQGCASLRRRVDNSREIIGQSMGKRFAREVKATAELESALAALSPLAVLGRGYSLVRKQGGTLVRSADQVAVGESLSLQFHRGQARALVEVTGDGGGDE